MTSFLDRLIGRNRISSAEIAKERLKLVLVTDRSSLPQERLEAMQAEILEVIKRYMDIDEPQIEMKVEQRQRENYLVADIPLHRSRSAYQAASEQAQQPDPAPPAESSRVEIAPSDVTRPKSPSEVSSQVKAARNKKTSPPAPDESGDQDEQDEDL